MNTKHAKNLCNHRDYNAISWKEIFEIDQSSPSGLKWLQRVSPRIPKDRSAGTRFYRYGKLDKKPLAYQVRHGGSVWLVHRIIWCIAHGSIDRRMVIDHINGSPFDNRIENLMLKTLHGNAQNRMMIASNSSGINGIRFCKTNNYWQAQWYDGDGNLHRKCFKRSKYGDDEAKRLACEHREKAIAALNESGAQYTERHGVKPNATRIL